MKRSFYETKYQKSCKINLPNRNTTPYTVKGWIVLQKLQWKNSAFKQILNVKLELIAFVSESQNIWLFLKFFLHLLSPFDYFCLRTVIVMLIGEYSASLFTLAYLAMKTDGDTPLISSLYTNESIHLVSIINMEWLIVYIKGPQVRIFKSRCSSVSKRNFMFYLYNIVQSRLRFRAYSSSSF